MRGGAQDLLLRRAGQLLAAASFAEYQVRLWDLRTSQLVRVFSSQQPDHLAFSPDSKLLASVGWDNTIVLWDTAQMQPQLQFRSDDGPLSSVAFFPDGKRILSSGGGPDAHLWDVDFARWTVLACAIANRNLSRAEWRQYVGDAAVYEPVCRELPVPDE